MKTRILSGVIITRNVPTGTATIEYKDNTLVIADTTPGVSLAKTYETGDPMPADDRFLSRPAHTFSLREIKVVETEWTRGSHHEGQEIERFKINTGTINRSSIQIMWESTGGSKIEEISYMIIGNVSRD